MDMCDYCGKSGCHYSRHPEAMRDIREWKAEERAMHFPFGDYRESID